MNEALTIGSMSADTREKGSPVYVATKAGIQGFSEALRKEVNPLGVKVTLIEPGVVGTDMQDQYSPEEQRQKEDGDGQGRGYCRVYPIRDHAAEALRRRHDESAPPAEYMIQLLPQGVTGKRPRPHGRHVEMGRREVPPCQGGYTAIDVCL